MAEWSKAVDSSIIEFFDGIIGFPTYPGFESQFYQIFNLSPCGNFYWILIMIVTTCVATCGKAGYGLGRVCSFSSLLLTPSCLIKADTSL